MSIQKNLFRSAVVVLTFIVLLTACSEDVPRSPAKPLMTTPEQLSQIYGIRAGAYTVADSEEFSVPMSADRELILRVLYPREKAAAKLPLLIFSHGNWSDLQKYDNVVRHWVTHGYVVVMPYHLDGGGMMRGIFNSIRYGQLGLINTRVDDFKFVMDNWSQIEAKIPALKDGVDLTRIAATGHSFGGFTAEQMGGAQAFDPDAKQFIPGSDSRVRAIVAISPPGKMFDTITEGSWTELTTPTLVTTGTWDDNKQFWPDWQAHLLSYQTARPNDKFSLVIEGADHYLGNLICRPERKEAPQKDALAMVNAISTAFLDAYIKDIPEAKQFLQQNPVSSLTGGFATLSQR
jgi:predicted dienelactone hydrolase